jgi:hypothetical protein
VMKILLSMALLFGSPCLHNPVNACSLDLDDNLILFLV